jgi:nucleotide-binding universal stress UspA family protein
MEQGLLTYVSRDEQSEAREHVMPSVVVGIDGTEASRQALRWAAGEAKLRGTVLRVVHTWSRPYAVSGPNPQPERPEVDEDETERRLARELFDRELAATGIEATGVRIEPELVEGSPAQKLLDAAQNADLLVIGSDRHERLAGNPLGRIGRECVQHSPCPVVIVRPAPLRD